MPPRCAPSRVITAARDSVVDGVAVRRGQVIAVDAARHVAGAGGAASRRPACSARSDSAIRARDLLPREPARRRRTSSGCARPSARRGLGRRGRDRARRPAPRASARGGRVGSGRAAGRRRRRAVTRPGHAPSADSGPARCDEPCAGTGRRLGIVTVRDLLTTFPRRYDDLREIVRRRAPRTRSRHGTLVTVRATVRADPRRSAPSGAGCWLTTAVLEDDSGEVEAVWFGRRFIERQLKAGRARRGQRQGQASRLACPARRPGVPARRRRPDAPRRPHRAGLPASLAGCPSRRCARPSARRSTASALPGVPAADRSSAGQPDDRRGHRGGPLPRRLRAARRGACDGSRTTSCWRSSWAWWRGDGSVAARRGRASSRSIRRRRRAPARRPSRRGSAPSRGPARRADRRPGRGHGRRPRRPRQADARCCASSRATSARARRPWRPTPWPWPPERRRAGRPAGADRPAGPPARRDAWRTCSTRPASAVDPADGLAERRPDGAPRWRRCATGQAQVVVGTHALLQRRRRLRAASTSSSSTSSIASASRSARRWRPRAGARTSCS